MMIFGSEGWLRFRIGDAVLAKKRANFGQKWRFFTQNGKCVVQWKCYKDHFRVETYQALVWYFCQQL